MLMKESEDLAAYTVTTEKYHQKGEKIISSSTACTNSKSEENPKKKGGVVRKKRVKNTEKEKEILSAIKKAKALPASPPNACDDKNLKMSESECIIKDSNEELGPIVVSQITFTLILCHFTTASINPTRRANKLKIKATNDKQ